MMKIIKYPPRETWLELLKRPLFETSQLDDTVKAVLDTVRKNGDNALKDYTLTFDKALIENFLVSEEELIQAEKKISISLKDAIKVASENIEKFHAAQKQTDSKIETMPGVTLKPVVRLKRTVSMKI